MKRCSRCSLEKDPTFFSVNRTKKDGRASICLECQREYNRNHYRHNKGYYIDKAAKRQDELVAEVRALKQRPCFDCGKEYPYYVMDFDHRQDKKFNISERLNYGARTQILKEIEKCDVVCSNCHRERTHRRSENLPVSPLATNQLKE